MVTPRRRAPFVAPLDCPSFARRLGPSAPSPSPRRASRCPARPARDAAAVSRAAHPAPLRPRPLRCDLHPSRRPCSLRSRAGRPAANSFWHARSHRPRSSFSALLSQGSPRDVADPCQSAKNRRGQVQCARPAWLRGLRLPNKQQCRWTDGEGAVAQAVAAGLPETSLTAWFKFIAANPEQPRFRVSRHVVGLLL